MKMIMTLLAAMALSLCSGATPENPRFKDIPDEDGTAKFTDLDADGFAKFIENEKVQVLDARTAEEYAGGHIKGSVNIDVESWDFKDKASSTLKKDAPVAVYCRSGRRSVTASIFLVEEGFTEVYNLKTGINGWIQAGLPTESE